MTSGTLPRALARILLAVGLLSGVLVPVAHAADDRAVGWILTRTGAAAVTLEGSLVASGISGQSAVAMFATTGTRAHRRVDYRFGTTTAEWGVDGWARVNDDTLPNTSCQVACENPVGVQRSVYVSSNGRAL